MSVSNSFQPGAYDELSQSTLGPQTPSDLLELQAAEQRRRLHNTVVELRSTVRESVNVRKSVRTHLLPAAGAVAIVGLIMGYAIGGIFVR